MEVKHVNGHFSKKEKQEMTLFESFIMEGDERAVELARDWSMLD